MPIIVPANAQAITPVIGPVLGKVRQLVSDGGPHEAWRWARVTVSAIVDVHKGSPEPKKCEKFRSLLAEALEPFFRKPDPANAENAFKQFKEIFQRSPWSAALSAPDVAPVMFDRIRKSLISAQLDQGAY